MTRPLVVRALAALALVGAARAQLAFEPALGRAEAGSFVARAGGVLLNAREGGLGIALVRSEHEGAAIALEFGVARPEGELERCVTLTRFKGHEAFHTDRVHTRLRYRGVAPGVELVLREGEGGFEYDLDLGRDARPELFEAQVRGHEALWIDPDGALVIETAVGALVQPPPLAWSLADCRKLACRFELRGPDRFGFALEPRAIGTRARIDPALRFSTYLTGENEQDVEAVAHGPFGVALAAGTSYSLDFPTTLGAFDPFFNGGTEAFVSCLSADGRELLWSTLIGGSGDELARSVVVTPSGGVIVGGDTTSGDFPTTAGALQPVFGGVRDVFVARLEGSGTALEWSTYIGGALADRFGELALGANEEPVLCGGTRGGLPTSAGAFDTTYNGGPFFGDAFVARLARDGGSRVWCTYFGSAGEELAERLALDANDGVVVAGQAYSSSFPTSAGAFDTTFSGPSEAWVARFSANGAQRVFSTFLGGSAEESVLTLLVEPSGDVLCGGETLSVDFPVVSGAFDSTFGGASEGFIARLSALGTTLSDSTFFGGDDLDRVSALAFDPSGALIVGGDSLSEGLPTTPGAYQPQPRMPIGGVEREVFLGRMPTTLAGFDYLTHFGCPQPDWLRALAVDSDGEVLFGGTTYGPGLPVSVGAFQPDWNVLALSQGYVSKLALLVHPISFGTGKLNSQGGRAEMRWEGFPSVTETGFRVGCDFALPNAWSQSLRSLARQDVPFLGSRLYLVPPFKRLQRVKTDFLGYAMRDATFEPWLVGQTVYFQVWYEDSGSPQGAALSNALEVIVYP